MERSKLQASFEIKKKLIASIQNLSRILYFLHRNFSRFFGNIFWSPHLVFTIFSVFFYHSQPSPYREACAVSNCYSIFQIIACLDETMMIPEVMMTALAISYVPLVLRNNKYSNIAEFLSLLSEGPSYASSSRSADSPCTCTMSSRRPAIWLLTFK